MATENEIVNINADVNVSEIGDVSDALNGMAKSLENIEGASNASASGASKTQSAFENLRGAADLFNESMGALGTAMGMAQGAFNATIQPFIDMEEAQNRFSAQTGLAGQELDAFNGIARELYESGLGENLSDVYSQMGAVRNITQQSGEELENTTRHAMNFGRVFDRDINESTRAANVIMKNFGINSEQAFDLLTVGMQQTGDPSQDLLDTFQEYSPVFEDMGLSAEQSMGLIAQFMEAGGRNTDVAADALKEFNIRLSDQTAREGLRFLSSESRTAFNDFANGSITAADALGVIIQDINAIEDPTARAAAGVAFFGTKWEDAAGAIAAFDPSSAVNGLGQIEGASNNAANTLDSGITPAFERMKRSLEGAVMEVAADDIETGLQGLTAFLDFVTAASDLEVTPQVTVIPDWTMLPEQDMQALGVDIQAQAEAQPIEIDKMSVVISSIGLAIGEAVGIEFSEEDQLKVYDAVSKLLDIGSGEQMRENLQTSLDTLDLSWIGTAITEKLSTIAIDPEDNPIANLFDFGALQENINTSLETLDLSYIPNAIALSLSGVDTTVLQEALSGMFIFPEIQGADTWVKAQIIDKAVNALRGSYNAFAGALNEAIPDGFSIPLGNYQKDLPDPLPDIDINLGTLDINIPANPIPTRDSGGMGQAGQPYLIGTGAQPELFVPSSTGNFYPVGQYGGGTTTANINLYLDGQVVYSAMQNIAQGGGN